MSDGAAPSPVGRTMSGATARRPVRTRPGHGRSPTVKVEEARAAYQEVSALFGENLRRVCFAGIAAVWVFRVDTPNSSATLPTEFAVALGLLVLALVVDLAQYAVQTATWGIWSRRREKQGRANDELAPDWFNWAPLLLVCFKGACGGAGLIVLSVSIWTVAF